MLNASLFSPGPVAVIFAVAISGCSQQISVENRVGSSESAAAVEPTASERGGGAEGPSAEDAGEDATEKTSPPASTALYSPEAFRDAALNGKRRIVEVCLEGGMEVDLPDPNGFTALAMAAYNGHDNVVKLLLDSGATVDSRDRLGNTPLIHAASGPSPTTVTMLLDAGAEINAVDSGEHFTALMMAAAEGNTEVVQVLLERGAKKDMVDSDGDAAIDFARRSGHGEIVALLSDE